MKRQGNHAATLAIAIAFAYLIGSMSFLLNCRSLTKSYGPRTLFKGISLGFAEGERSGLIGPNGAGKSTLIKILADLEQPDEGVLESRRGLRTGYVPQFDEFEPAQTVEQVLVDALRDRPIDDHDRVARAAILLGKMSFPDPDQLASALSGGWKKRLAIARAIITEPDLLLMDEPTNHLDLQGILWLEKTLKSAPFACLVITHDRYFLESVTNRVVELNRAYPEGFFSVSGPYSDFLEKREEFLAAQHAQQTALASRVRGEIEWLKRGAKARTTKAKGRIEHANEMMADLAELKVRNSQGRTADIDFSASGRKTRKLLAAVNLSKSLGGRTLFKDVSFTLSPRMKLGILGPNGSGKSTLLRILAAELAPDSGTILRADQLKIVKFDQARETLEPNLTLRDAISPSGDTVFYPGGSMHVTSWAKRFLFRTEQLDLTLSQLSGGEQARVLIARLMQRPADLLILDEPTNDLDIATLEVLEESLEEFPGALVLVTHDRYMLDNLSTDLLGLDGSGNADLYADFAQWEQSQQSQRQATPPRPPGKPAATDKRPAARKLPYLEQREWEQIEQRIMEAESEVDAAQSEMNHPQTLSDRDKLHAACDRLSKAQQEVHRLYARWEELDAKQA